MKFKNINLENFFYDANTIEKYEIELFTKMFTNLKFIVLKAENILETQVNLLELKKIENIFLIVMASSDFEGEVMDDEEVEED